MLRTVLVAYDGSASAEDALSLAIELVRCLQADMHIVTVISTVREQSAADVAAVRRYAWQRLREAEDLAARFGLSVRLDVVEGEPAAELIQHARRLTADVIVVGHGHHGALDQLTGASVATRLLQHAPCAVLTPRVRGAHAATA